VDPRTAGSRSPGWFGIRAAHAAPILEVEADGHRRRMLALLEPEPLFMLLAIFAGLSAWAT
jgi:hypothetical protein